MGLLEQKVAIVSGIGPGLGRATALKLAAAGADVVLAARTEARLAEVAQEATWCFVRSRAIQRSGLEVPAVMASATWPPWRPPKLDTNGRVTRHLLTPWRLPT